MQYWRFEEGDMIFIETEDHIWMLRSRCGEILSDFVSHTRYDLFNEDSCIEKVTVI